MQVSLPPSPTFQRTTALWKQVRANIWAYCYLAPMFVLIMVFTIYPIGASAVYTLYNWDGIGAATEYVGLKNFQTIMHDPFFWEAFVHTFLFVGAVVTIQLTLALILALVLNDRQLRGRTFYRTVYFLPVVTSQAVIGIVIQLILSTSGDDLSKLLVKLHISQSPIDWLGNPFWAFVIVVVIGIWNYLGVNLVNFLAALQSVPTELYEAAQIDGANAPARFFSITLPMLRGVGFVILILAILNGLGTFDLIQVVTGGGPYFATELISTYIYHKAFGSFGAPGATAVTPNIGLASAAAFFFGVMIIGLTVGQLLIARYAARIRSENQ